jgi:hypothetical protein
MRISRVSRHANGLLAVAVIATTSRYAGAQVALEVVDDLSGVALHDFHSSERSSDSSEKSLLSPGIFQARAHVVDSVAGERQSGSLLVSGRGPFNPPDPPIVWTACPLVEGSTWTRQVGAAEWTQVHAQTHQHCFGPFDFISVAEDRAGGGLIFLLRESVQYTHYSHDEHHVCAGEMTSFRATPGGKEEFSGGLCQSLESGDAPMVTNLDEQRIAGRPVSLQAGDEYRMDLRITDGKQVFEASRVWRLEPTAYSESTAGCDRSPAEWFGELPHRVPPHLLPARSCGSFSVEYAGLCGGGRSCP